MTEEEILEMAQDQLEIACQNLVNQKNKASDAYKAAAYEVESCLTALKAVEARIINNPQVLQTYRQKIV